MNTYRGNSSDSSDSNSSEDENCHLKILRKKKNIKANDRPTVDTPAFTAQQSEWLKGDFKLLQDSLKEKPVPTVSSSSAPAPTDKPKRKKNNIWSNVLTEQVLSDDITHSFGLKNLEGDRSVENYDYKAAQQLLASQREQEEGVEEGELIEEQPIEEELEEGEMREETQFDKNRLSRKRTYHSRHHNRHPKIVIEAAPGVALELPPISDTMSALSDTELANVIAENMKEQKPDLIQRVMQVLGREKTTEAYEKTRKKELEGGDMIANGNRRRTSGGIFLQNIKSLGLSKEQSSSIFVVDEEQAMWKKRKRAHNRRKNRDAEAASTVTSTADKEMVDYSSDALRLTGTKCPGSTPVTTPLVSPAVSPVPSPLESHCDEDLPDTTNKEEISDCSATKTEAEVTSSSQEEMDVA